MSNKMSLSLKRTGILLLLLNVLSLHAQIKDNLKLTLETGFPVFSKSNNLSFFLNIEPKLEVFENTFIGLRVGLILNAQSFENKDSLVYQINEAADHGYFSFLATLEHTFMLEKFRPYAGIGLGPYLIENRTDIIDRTAINPSQAIFESEIKYQLGFLLKGGIELGKTRIGLEYNFIPISDVKIADGTTIGTVKSSYLGFVFSYTLGNE